MEPIRPDDDELRADERPAGMDRTKTESPGGSPAGGGGHSSGKSHGGGSGRSGGNGILWLLLIVVAGAAGAGWYLQNERINAMAVELEEADNWARQSKLALARFEGDLSETGESLQERGASLKDQIAANAEQLETADSEIRKLWAVANERNKSRLDEHQQRLAELDDALAAANKSAADLETTLQQARSSLRGDVSQLDQRLKNSVGALEKADQDMSGQLATLDEQMSGVGQRVDSRIRRFEQEQKLTIDGLDSRITSLEKQVGAMADNEALRAVRRDLSDLKQTVDAIDASRSQLTSRLVRLSEELNQLRSQ